MPKWIGELIFSLLILALGIVFGAEAYKLGPSRLGTFVGPSFFPIVLSSALVLLAVFNIYQVISQRAENGNKFAFSMTLTAGSVLCILYVYLIPILGYFYITPVFGVCFLFLQGNRKPMQIFLMTAGFTLTAYIVFYRLLSVRLPV